jgi:hypothetical protein
VEATHLRSARRLLDVILAQEWESLSAGIRSDFTTFAKYYSIDFLGRDLKYNTALKYYKSDGESNPERQQKTERRHETETTTTGNITTTRNRTTTREAKRLISA